jgi:hypothetical protein
MSVTIPLPFRPTLIYFVKLVLVCQFSGRQTGRTSSLGEVNNFPFCIPALHSTQPPIQWVQGALSSGVKQSGREAHYSSSTSAEVKKTQMYTSTPPYPFMALCLVKHRDSVALPSLHAGLEVPL